jgi:hypothetical protein
MLQFKYWNNLPVRFVNTVGLQVSITASPTLPLVVVACQSGTVAIAMPQTPKAASGMAVVLPAAESHWFMMSVGGKGKVLPNANAEQYPAFTGSTRPSFRSLTT